jgi:hypothetical protein
MSPTFRGKQETGFDSRLCVPELADQPDRKDSVLFEPKKSSIA